MVQILWGSMMTVIVMHTSMVSILLLRLLGRFGDC